MYLYGMINWNVTINPYLFINDNNKLDNKNDLLYIIPDNYI